MKYAVICKGCKSKDCKQPATNRVLFCPNYEQKDKVDPEVQK